MEEVIGSIETRDQRSLLPGIVGRCVHAAVNVCVEHTRSKLSGMQEIEGYLPGGIGFRIFNLDNSTFAYTIGGIGLPAVDAAFMFGKGGNWHFERTVQECLGCYGVVTHQFDSTHTNTPRDTVQVVRSCHFILNHSV